MLIHTNSLVVVDEFPNVVNEGVPISGFRVLVDHSRLCSEEGQSAKYS